MTAFWVGSTDPAVLQYAGNVVFPAAAATKPTFLARHPRLPRVYAVDESDVGGLTTFEIGSGTLIERTGRPSRGSQPCHLCVHPSGEYLYISNYGDGVVTAVALDEEGDPHDSDRDIVLAHAGSGPDEERQNRSHAHFTALSPCGRWLLALDLGTDHLRAYRMDGGRPGPSPVLTALPPGSGPRHLVAAGNRLYVACELSGDVLSLAWDRDSGAATVIGATSAIGVEPRTGDRNYLSHIDRVGAALLVGVRGADAIAVLPIRDGCAGPVAVYVPTVAWPRHFAVTEEVVVVAGEREDALGIHPRRPDGVGECAHRVPAASPMCLLPQ